jgi:hypothetical protein
LYAENIFYHDPERNAGKKHTTMEVAIMAKATMDVRIITTIMTKAKSPSIQISLLSPET